MRIALLHYHLQGGGVTRIVLHQLQALRDQGVKAIVLTGKEPPFPMPFPNRIIPGLLYEANRPTLTVTDLVQQMRAAARDALGGTVDIWHVHNHSLGKNLLLPPALSTLAQQGERLLLQIHDFAEDGRPANYRAMLAHMADEDPKVLRQLLYPQASHIHYAVLNSRDYSYIRGAGLDSQQLHLLPNPVGFAPAEQGPKDQPLPVKEPLWLYPTRAIRRKNIGEFLLWSALAPQGTRFATTAGPQNPEEWQRYQHWQKVAADLHLPVSFEKAGRAGSDFVNLIRRATCVVATSVAEGFGMAFLEPWLLGTPVCGRDLPEITANFRQEGLLLPYTYERLDVPVAWLGGREKIRSIAMAGLRRNLAAYAREPEADSEERLMAAWIRENRVDFGRLNEEMQESIIRHLAQDRKKATELQPAALPAPDDPQRLMQTTENNHQILRARYNLNQYGAALVKIYGHMLQSKAEEKLGALNGQALLDHFLAPERLTLLRVD